MSSNHNAQKEKANQLDSVREIEACVLFWNTYSLISPTQNRRWGHIWHTTDTCQETPILCFPSAAMSLTWGHRLHCRLQYCQCLKIVHRYGRTFSSNVPRLSYQKPYFAVCASSKRALFVLHNLKVNIRNPKRHSMEPEVLFDLLRMSIRKNAGDFWKGQGPRVYGSTR